VVGGEGQHAVELVVGALEAVEHVAVGLVDVEGVLAEQRRLHVGEVEAVGTVGLEAVVLDPVAVLAEPALERHVRRLGAGAEHLQVAELVVALDVGVVGVVAGDGHEVDDLAAGDDEVVLDDASVVLLGARRVPAGLLPVDAGQHVDVGALLAHRVHGRLHVAVLALLQQLHVELAQLLARQLLDPLLGVGFTDDDHVGGLLQ
tara:strand:+ start:849 stop:1457 length:609 start_codon:yes stop_codon:yes gene_type:complete